MVCGKFVTEKKDMEMAERIFRRIFEEELGLEHPGASTDEFCLSALVFADGEPAGMGRILFDRERVTIAEIAVLPGYRGKKYGDFLARLLVDKAVMSNAREIRLDALQGTEEFFAAIGFQKDGVRFDSCGGQWQPMLLCVDCIHKCCGCG